MSLVVLEAHEYVHRECQRIYETRARSAQDLVRQQEPGMLVHMQTLVAQNDTVVTYRWLEVCRDVDALITHLTSEYITAHAAFLDNGILARPSDVVIYGTLLPDKKAVLQGIARNLVFARTTAAFFRNARSVPPVVKHD